MSRRYASAILRTIGFAGFAGFAWLIAAGAAAGGAPAEQASAADRCAPAEGLHFLCGTGAAEEIVRVPGTRWLIASGLNIGAPAHLRLIDTASKQAMVLPVTFAARASDSACPGPPDPARWSTDGLAIAGTPTTGLRLFAANHGDRRAIEMFDIRIDKAGPQARWTGCAVLPAETLGNGIAALDAQTLYVTSFHAPDDPDAWSRMARRDSTGSVWSWRASEGFTRVAIGPISGANGIAASPDGRFLYVSAWSESALVVLDRRTGERRRIPLDFLPDNIHVDAAGRLLVGGQKTTVAAIGACGPQCPQPWVVVRIDPASGRVLPLASGSGTSAVNYACGALEAGGTMYITVRGDDRIAYKVPEAARKASKQGMPAA